MESNIILLIVVLIKCVTVIVCVALAVGADIKITLAHKNDYTIPKEQQGNDEPPLDPNDLPPTFDAIVAAVQETFMEGDLND